jgi:hypothetical protein
MKSKMKAALSMNVSFKNIGVLLLLALLVSSAGCMTNAAINHATGTTSRDFPSGTSEVIRYDMHSEPHPGYYLLLPFTVPADIITSPFQLGYYLWYRYGHGPYSMHDSK